MKNKTQTKTALDYSKNTGKFILLLFLCNLIFTSCGNGLSRGKAEKLIKEFYEYPNCEVKDLQLDRNINIAETDLKSWDRSYQSAINENLMAREAYVYDNPFRSEEMVKATYYFTELGNKFIFSIDENYRSGTLAEVITSSIDFDEITGIIIDEQNKIATIDFTCKRIGITPFGADSGLKEGEIINKKVNMQKYDDGWRFVFESNDDGEIYVANDPENISPKDFPFFNAKGEYIGLK